MRRPTLIALMVVAGLTFAAPTLKDESKKNTSIVGKWQMVSCDGRRYSDYRTSETFRADGTRLTWRRIGEEEREIGGRYTVDTTTEPAQVDFLYGNGRVLMQGIFKVEGDTLTVCFRVVGSPRPEKFGEEDAATVVYERVQPKD